MKVRRIKFWISADSFERLVASNRQIRTRYKEFVGEMVIRQSCLAMTIMNMHIPGPGKYKNSGAKLVIISFWVFLFLRPIL